ncbi:hypothetical protein [Sulfurimonas sp.]|uniref:hypothetical protein n=1 Tax=Sulfurimonas sp. TaxID=2022749 RepID=UPI002AB2A7B0|nr:hypothetical protein [Sulfurimonas sp.]
MLLMVKNIFVKEDEFSLKQAENFADRYEVKAVADSLVTGLDAVLFYDTIDSKYVLSIRGSTSYADYVSDVILATTGVAYGQLMALNDFYSEWVLDGTIPIGAKLDVTGHSLGGALAQMFSAIHPNGVENTYSYNAPGIGGLTTDAYNILGIDPQNALFLNITNIYAKEGPEATAGLGTMLGSVVPVSIDEDWALGNHRMGHLTESLYMHNMLSEITGEQNLNSLTSILEKVSNERVIQIVDDVFLDQQSALGIIDQAIALTDNNQGKATGLTNLTNKSASELNSREKSNLYALLNSNPFAIQGNLPAYTDINPSDYSDMYMSDRADYLYYILDKDARYGDGSGKDSYKAFDSYGTSLSGKTGNQVIFGTDNYNNDIQMSGDIGNDRIYGLGGDDELVGKEGNDILDAGTGNDTLIGGIDKESSDDETDILIGGEGDDTYYAGNGDIIEDSDATGEIYFHNESLKDIIATNTTENPNVYKSVNYTFTKSGDDLIVVDETINKEFIIKNFLLNGKQDESSYSAIGITLEDDTVNEIGKKYKEVSTQEDYDKYIALGYEVKWSGDNTFNATDRDDSINVGVGNDTAYGGAGDDFFSSTDGNDYFYGEDGKDIIKVAGNNNYIDGGAHSDTISTGNNSTVFWWKWC